jgi:HEAT repeat protein
MGNSADQKFIPLLRRLEGDEDEILRESAAWGLGKLLSGGAHR